MGPALPNMTAVLFSISDFIILWSPTLYEGNGTPLKIYCAFLALHLLLTKYLLGKCNYWDHILKSTAYTLTFDEVLAMIWGTCS
jgi:hypothetical protein